MTTPNVKLAYDRDSVSLTYLRAGEWVPLKVASINYQASYDPDDNDTLIIGSETLTLALSGNGPVPIKEPLTLLKLAYLHGGKTYPVGSGLFKLDSYRRVYTTDPAAMNVGKPFKTEASCSAVAAYASALDVQVTYAKTRPANETAYHFITSVGVEVTNWPGGG